MALISTVSENKKNFTKTQVNRADLARKVYEILMFPSIRDFKHLMMTNGIKNCPITIEDINISEKIYGPNVYSIKGKSTRSNPTPKIDDRVEITPELKVAHQMVVYCADIMYVQGVMFLITISKNIHLITVTHVRTRSAGVLSEAFDEVFRLYNRAGFTIAYLHVDPEFKLLRKRMEDNDIEVSFASAQEHVPEVERCICTVKERYCTLVQKLPYHVMPTTMIVYGIADCLMVKLLPSQGWHFECPQSLSFVYSTTH